MKCACRAVKREVAEAARRVRMRPDGRQRVLSIILVIYTILFVTPSRAGEVSGATITAVQASGIGVFVYVNIAPTGVPSCGTQTTTTYRFVVDPSTPYGMTVVATALSAHATASSVDIVGLGTCGVWSDTETINYIIEH
jgi:hypothetical protein